MISVAEVDGALTRELRRRVLRPGLGTDDMLPGDDLTDAVHLAAYDGDAIVGTCFVSPEPCAFRNEPHAWRLRSMATEPERQSRGIGTLVLTTVHDLLQRRAVPLVWCHARLPAVAFYARSGWLQDGDVFDAFLVPDEPIPHQRMWRELAGRPTSSE